MPLPAHLLKQNCKPGTGCRDAVGVQGNRSSHLLAPSKPFLQSRALSALFLGKPPPPPHALA